MGARTARVIAVQDPVSIPESGQSAIAVLTDLPRRCSAFYVPVGSPTPPIGAQVAWDGGHVWWAGARAKKVDYDFDPDAPLR